MTTIYLINRSPSTTLEKNTPIDLWSGHPAIYKMLRIFGSVAYSHVNQGKLKPRAIKCIFLGYPDGVKGYRLWRLDDVKPRIIISRDVVFNENLMYKDTLKGAGAAGSRKEVEFEVELQGSRVELTVDPHTEENPGNKDEEQDEEPQQQNLDNYVLVHDRAKITITIPVRYRDEGNISLSRPSGSKVDDMAAYALAIAEEEDTHKSIIFHEAINSSENDEWVRAMEEETSSLKKNHTWELVDQPHGQKLVRCKWLYKIKEGSEGVQKPRYKARLVARGFTHRAGIDYNEVFSPVVRHTSIRVILSLTACEDYELEQLDVKMMFLHVDTQLNQKFFQRDNSVSNQSAPSFDQYFELNELKVQSQEKDTVIKKLKERIKSLSENMNEDKVKKDIEEIETINIELDHREKGLVITALKDELRKLKGKDLADNIVTKNTIAPEMLNFDVEPIAPKLLNNRTAHSDYLRHTQEQAAILREVVEQGKSQNPLNNSLDSACKYSKRIQEMLIIIRQTCPSINNSSDKLVAVTPKNKDKRVRFIEPVTSLGNTNTKTASSSNLCNGCMLSDNHDLCVLDFINDVNARAKSKSVKKSSKRKVWKPTSKMFTKTGYTWRPTGRTFTIIGNACPLTRITTTIKVPPRKPIALENETPKPIVTLVYSRKPRKSKINDLVSKPKIIKSLSANNKEPRSRGNNLYTLSLGDMMASSPICLLSKASKTKSWLWHRRLSHLNFGAINHLARHGLVRGLLKLKFEKDHLCSACAMGENKKKPHKPKCENTNQEKFYLLHMDLCGPMRVASVNEKKYILVIVDDYSRFTWVKCLRSKDEALDFIIKFLTMIQVRLKAPVRRIRTDNETEFVNQTLYEYYEKVGIFHETFVACSPHQNGVIERRNRTLIEAASTMLIYTKTLLFLWAEAVATTYFDELTTIASEHNSSEPALHDMTPITISSGLVPNPPPSTSFVPPSITDWDLLFQPLFDELLNPPPSVDLPAPKVIAPITEVVALEPAVSTGSPSSTNVDQDAPSLSNSQTIPETQSPVISNDVKEENHNLDVAHMNNDPFFGIPIPENNSEASSSSDLIPNIMHTSAPNSKHANKWTKDHPRQHHRYKDALTQACWIEAMQEELNEFKRLKVWELIPRLEKVMLITLKWIYKISQSPIGIFKNQSKYALESLKKYGMESNDPVDTPMVEKSKLDEDTQGKAIDPTYYRGMVGTLMYLTASKPDLTFYVCMCARYQAKPTKKHLHAVKIIFKYQRGTINRGLWYIRDSYIALTAYVDVDHVGCQDTRRSTSGCKQLLGDRLVSWSSKRHKSVAISSTEAEYIACLLVKNGVVELYFVNTEYQLADIFTKALGRERIKFLINKLGMRSFTPESLKQLADEAEE
ncbi:integrase, catalytic region, zinc finger, CCHC-type containing protein [Tanacetum coccineum]